MRQICSFSPAPTALLNVDLYQGVTMPNLIEKLQADLKSSLKSGEKERANSIRFLISQIQYARIEKMEELTDEDVISVLSKQAKNRKESIDAFREGDRDDLVDKETRELEIIESYLPEQLGESEIRKILKTVIEEEGLGGMSDMGRLMKSAMARLKGQADGSLVSELAQEELKQVTD